MSSTNKGDRDHDVKVSITVPTNNELEDAYTFADQFEKALRKREIEEKKAKKRKKIMAICVTVGLSLIFAMIVTYFIYLLVTA